MLNVNMQARTRPRTNGLESRKSEGMPFDSKIDAVLRLHQYLATHHWSGRALVGPNAGGIFNYGVSKFVWKYFRKTRPNEELYSARVQGYWTLANWRLFSNSGGNKYRDFAVRCSDYMLMQQRGDGAWVCPELESRGPIATAEGTWGSLGLLESYRQTGDTRYLAAVRKWYRFLVCEIGFQQVGAELTVNHSHGTKGARILNDSALVLRFLAELAETTRQETYRRLCTGLLKFLGNAQDTSGEFPHSVRGEMGGRGRSHYRCFQQNGSLCLDLMRYCDFTSDTRALLLVRRVLGFLRLGIAEDGHAYFACDSRSREVNHHTAVLAQAFERANELGINGFDGLANQAYNHLLSGQRPDGGFPFSRCGYSLFNDQRSYPRNLGMILYHLLPATPVRIHRTALNPNPVGQTN